MKIDKKEIEYYYGTYFVTKTYKNRDGQEWPDDVYMPGIEYKKLMTREDAMKWKSKQAFQKERGISFKIKSLKQIMKDEEMFEYLLRSIAHDLKKYTEKELDYYYRDLDQNRGRTGSALEALKKGILDVINKEEVTIEEIVNIAPKQITLECNAEEDINATFRTSCWSTSVEGEWKTVDGNVYKFSGWTVGDAARV